jgi:hypothetical protein
MAKPGSTDPVAWRRRIGCSGRDGVRVVGLDDSAGAVGAWGRFGGNVLGHFRAGFVAPGGRVVLWLSVIARVRCQAATGSARTRLSALM